MIKTEFPEIRIDYFLTNPNVAPPLACFLSHVHSDHLLGLESLRAPFIYCSAATKEVSFSPLLLSRDADSCVNSDSHQLQILLRLEKFPHRLNFAKGILEYRIQTYRHLSKLLKPIPLSTPTTIELSPDNEIRVTLFDANHCVGAVMFLIEGSGKAILYTGDIRSEPWWVNSLVRNPVLLPYATGSRTLDTIYLDTTFATKAESHREFQSKAQGLKELLEKVQRFSKDTIFFVEAWTFGYEDVWIALSNFLGEKVHLDQYRYGIYTSLAKANNGLGCFDSPALSGFKVGNHYKEGCLTLDHNTRIHSCEHGFACPIINEFRNPNVVRIVPIISRATDGREMHEVGVGGGKGDLDLVHELEFQDSNALRMLMQRCASSIDDEKTLFSVYQMLIESSTEGRHRSRLTLLMNDVEAVDDMELDKFIDILVRQANDKPIIGSMREDRASTSKTDDLPKEITFPYSRHSSYDELCALVEAFHPRDI